MDKVVITAAIAAVALVASGVLLATTIAIHRAEREFLKDLGEPDQSDDLEAMIEHLVRSMRESAGLVERVSSELEARRAVAARLQEEAKSAQEIARLNQAERDAVARLLRAQLTEEITAQMRRNFRQSTWLAVASFVAGAGASLAITLLVHPA
jgi:phosphoglycolate phosphatase-like HAD superfamily hydrolase